MVTPSLGHVVSLPAVRASPHGVYLLDGDQEILLPNAEVGVLDRGQAVEVFVYLDSEDRPTATRARPRAIVGEAAWMRIADAGPAGAFADWGLPKQLLVPHREQRERLRSGDEAMVAVYLDGRSGRLCGTTQILDALPKEGPYAVGDELRVVPFERREGGLLGVADGRVVAWLADFGNLHLGRPVTGYVRRSEPGRLALGPRPVGMAGQQNDLDTLRALLKRGHGFVGVTDADPPERVRQVTGLSKAAFKRAVGGLLKIGEISLESHGIRATGSLGQTS